MRMSLMTGFMVLLFAFATPAMAEWTNFVSASGAYTIPMDSDIEIGWVKFSAGLDNGFGGMIEAGFIHDSGFRLGYELGYRWLEGDGNVSVSSFRAYSPLLDGAKWNTLSNMVNLWYVSAAADLPVKAYIGAGLGLGIHESDDGDKSEFAFQGMVGLAYDVTPELEGRMGYRYFGTTDIKGEYLGYRTSISYDTHAFEFGLLYRFN